MVKFALEEVPLHQDLYAFCCNKESGPGGFHYLLANKDTEYFVRPSLRVEALHNFEDYLGINDAWKHSGYLPKELLV